MKRFTLVTFFAICISALFALNASAKTQLTYANFFPPTHIQSQLAESWCEEVEKRTGGEVVVKYFPAQALTKAPQTYDAVVSGIADIGMTVLAYSRGRFAVAQAIDLPMGYKSGVQATAIANKVLDKFQPKEFNDTKVMFFHAHGPGLIHTADKAVATMEDIKGLKIRTTGASGAIIKELGGSPVGKSMSECYQMLQKGVVDGSLHPVEANKGWKLGEVVDYVTAAYPIAYTTTFAVFMNKSKWAKLSPAAQKAIKDINTEWAAKHGEAWDASDKAGLEFFKSKGGKVIEISDEEAAKWKTAMQPVIDGYIESVSEKGIDGKAVVDFIQSNM